VIPVLDPFVDALTSFEAGISKAGGTGVHYNSYIYSFIQYIHILVCPIDISIYQYFLSFRIKGEAGPTCPAGPAIHQIFQMS
jgi:hypothetical protein